MHAATFGGNPIAAVAGIATIEMIEEEGLLERAKQLSEAFRSRLAPLVEELPYVAEFRACGPDDRPGVDGRGRAGRASAAWSRAS